LIIAVQGKIQDLERPNSKWRKRGAGEMQKLGRMGTFDESGRDKVTGD
jgi:hypothetical protein